MIILVDTSTFLTLDQSLDSMKLIPTILNFLPAIVFFLVYFGMIGYLTNIEKVLYP